MKRALHWLTLLALALSLSLLAGCSSKQALNEEAAPPAEAVAQSQPDASSPAPGDDSKLSPEQPPAPNNAGPAPQPTNAEPKLPGDLQALPSVKPAPLAPGNTVVKPAPGNTAASKPKISGGDEADKKLLETLLAKQKSVKSIRTTTTMTMGPGKTITSKAVTSGAWTKVENSATPGAKQYVNTDEGSIYLANDAKKVAYKMVLPPETSELLKSKESSSMLDMLPTPPKITEAILGGQSVYKATLTMGEGFKITLWMDKAKGLPIKQEQTMGDQTVTTKFTYSGLNAVPESEAKLPTSYTIKEIKPDAQGKIPPELEKELQALMGGGM